MSLGDVVIVRTGVANVASVQAGLVRAGGRSRLTEDPRDVREADAVVLPGVGSFGAAMRTLRASGLAPAIVDRVRRGRPTLMICLGFQLLFEASEESPGVQGLGLLPGKVARFREGVRVPQLGWNRVAADPRAALLASGAAYFANSYRVSHVPDGWLPARTDHGETFVSALERGPVLGCQFHPELSGRYGEALLRRWLARAFGGGASC